MSSLNPEKVHNIRVIALCILAAATFWFLNALNDSYSTTIKYPIDINFDTEKYVATASLPEELQINVSGLGWNLFRSNLGINSNPIQFWPESPSEVKKVPSGTLLGVVTDQLKEFSVNFILTDTLYLNIDKKISRAYLIDVDSTTIQLEEGYWITSAINHSPDSVTLTGPESILNNLGDTLSISISQDEIDESFSEDIPIEVPRLNLVMRNPPTASVSFEVQEYKSITRDWPLTLINFPEDSSAYLMSNTYPVSFDISLSESSLINDDSFQIVADFNNINSADSTILPMLQLQEEIAKNVQLDTVAIKVIYNEQ